MQKYRGPITAARGETSAYQSAGELVIPTFIAISQSSSGDQTLVSGVAGKQIRVFSFLLTSAGTIILTWKSSTAGAISGPIPMVANSIIVGPENATGWLQTATGEGLVLNLSTSVSVGAHLTYGLVSP